jgi:HEPN domain-containing protein
MLTKADLQALASTRLEDALILFKAGRTSSAYYLAGYAVELALKACIAKAFQPDVIPDKAFVVEIYTHSLEKLLGAAGLTAQFTIDSKADPELAAAWGIASKWTEASRYSLWDSVTSGSLIAAIADQHHGVFQWVKKHW